MFFYLCTYIVLFIGGEHHFRCVSLHICLPCNPGSPRSPINILRRQLEMQAMLK